MTAPDHHDGDELAAVLDEIDSADMWATQADEAAKHGNYDAASALAQVATTHATIAQALAAVPAARAAIKAHKLDTVALAARLRAGRDDD